MHPSVLLKRPFNILKNYLTEQLLTACRIQPTCNMISPALRGDEERMFAIEPDGDQQAVIKTAY